MTWHDVCAIDDVAPNSGACARINGKQIAVFRFERLGKWFATSNVCPHWGEASLSRGLIGEHAGEPKVACPMHKRTFSLETGACHQGDVGGLETYPVELRGDRVWVAVGA